MNYKLIFIDDNMNEGIRHPFVRAIGKYNEDAEISVFTDPAQGLDYVLKNLSNRMIVFVDCKFDGYSLQGIQILKEIRKTTSLLYIVMMSANALNQIAGLDVIEMINEDYISFFDRNNGTIPQACELIKQIKTLWDVRFDCVLEDWLVRHQTDKDKKIITRGNKTFTWEELLSEVRHQTEMGKYFERVMNQYCIKQFKQEDE